jgi:hypothetical protein
MRLARECGVAKALILGIEPATHDHCTLGGMIGNNSCGTHSVMVGKTVDNVVELDVLTYDGLRMRVGKTGDTDLRNKYAGLVRKRCPQDHRNDQAQRRRRLAPAPNLAEQRTRDRNGMREDG